MGAETVQQRLQVACEIESMGNVCALVGAEAPEHRGIVVANRAGMELHDQPVFAAHAGHLDQHMRGESPSVSGSSVARQAPLKDSVGFAGQRAPR